MTVIDRMACAQTQRSLMFAPRFMRERCVCAQTVDHFKERRTRYMMNNAISTGQKLQRQSFLKFPPPPPDIKQVSPPPKPFCLNRKRCKSNVNSYASMKINQQILINIPIIT